VKNSGMCDSNGTELPIQRIDFDRLVMDSIEGARVEVSGMPDLSDPCLYTDREYSWLQFNERVLEEAFDERNPCLKASSSFRFLEVILMSFS